MNKRTQTTETNEVNDADMPIVNEIPSQNSTNERIQTKDLPSNDSSKFEYLKPKHCVPCPFYKEKKGYCLKGAKCVFLHNIKPRQYDQFNGRYNVPSVPGNLSSYNNYPFRNSPSAIVTIIHDLVVLGNYQGNKPFILSMFGNVFYKPIHLQQTLINSHLLVMPIIFPLFNNQPILL
jgi:hypothetical protein